MRAAVRGRRPLALFEHQHVGDPKGAVEATLRDGWVDRGKAFRVEPPIDWAADPFDSRSWRFRLNAMYFLPRFQQLYDQTGDAAAFELARDVFLDWIDFNIVRNVPNDFRWYDMAVGIRAPLLAALLDRALRRDDLTERQLLLLLRAASEHLAHLSNREELAQNNHALYQLVGLAGLCVGVPELIGCEEARRYAAREFVRIVDEQFNADAIHTENSPFYHGYALVVIDRIVATGWLEIASETREHLDRALTNLAWLIRPDGKYAQVGDSHGRPGTDQIERVRSRPAPGRDAGTHRTFPVGGYATLRAPSGDGPASDGFVFLTAAFHSRAHKHRDRLSFEWFDRGLPILVDSGVYGTNKDARRDYVRSTRAHNTIEVDGSDIDGGSPAAPELIATAAAGDTLVIAAQVEHPELSVRHRRIVVFGPGQWLLVHDEIGSTAILPHAYTAWFHFDPDAAVREATGAIAEARLPGVVEPLMMYDLTDRSEVTMVRGQTEPRLQGWVSGDYNELVPNHAVGLSRRGKTATFDTLFLFGDSGSAVPQMVSPFAVPFAKQIDLCWRQGRTIRGARVAVRDNRIEVRECAEQATR